MPQVVVQKTRNLHLYGCWWWDSQLESSKAPRAAGPQVAEVLQQSVHHRGKAETGPDHGYRVDIYIYTYFINLYVYIYYISLICIYIYIS